MALSRVFAGRQREDGVGTTITVSGLNSVGYDMAVAAVKYEGAGTTLTMSDSEGNTWTNQPQYGNDSTDYPAVMMSTAPLVSTDASHNFTVTLGAGRDFKELAIWFVDSEGAAVEVEDEVGAAANNPFTNPKDAGDLVTAGESVSIAFIAGYVGGLTWTVGTGWTEDNDADNDVKFSRHDGTSGTYAVEATPSNNTAFAGAAVAIAATAAGDEVSGSLTGSAGQMAGNLEATVDADGAISAPMNQVSGTLEAQVESAGAIGGAVGEISGSLSVGVLLASGAFDGGVGSVAGGLLALAEADGAIDGFVGEVGGALEARAEVSGGLVGAVGEAAGVATSTSIQAAGSLVGAVGEVAGDSEALAEVSGALVGSAGDVGGSVFDPSAPPNPVERDTVEYESVEYDTVENVDVEQMPI